jgi:GAF domain-containing protein
VNVGEFLVRLAQGLILLLTLWKLIEWARRRGSARLDVALLLLTLAIGVGLNWVETDTAFDLGVLKHAIPMVVLLHPLLMLRLVDHFRTVPRWISGLVFTGIATSWGLLLATPAPFATQGVVAVSVIFALSLLYGARALVAGARHAPNVVQRRMSLLGAGAIVVVLLASLQALTFAIGHIPYVTPLTQVGLLAAAVLYSLGLAPPPWLSRAWQQADVQQFLQATAGSAGESTERTLTRLCDTARHAVGGQAVALARWNDERKRLELELRGERALVGGPLPADGLVARQWTFRRPFVAEDRKQVRDACLRMAPGLDCTALLGVPLVTPTRVWGLLIIFLRRGPILPDEDLRLLSLITEHTAVLLDHGALVESLRRENSVLRGEPVPDETPFEES